MIMDYELELGNRQTLPLTVFFSWDAGYRGDFYEPPRGSGITDYAICLYLDGKNMDITDKLDDKVVESIISDIEERLRLEACDGKHYA